MSSWEGDLVKPDDKDGLAKLRTDIQVELSRLAVGHPAWPILSRCAEALAPVSTRMTIPRAANELAAMARDARRYREVKACDWIGLRVAGQEFVGVSNLDAWADARATASAIGTTREGK